MKNQRWFHLTRPAKYALLFPRARFRLRGVVKTQNTLCNFAGNVGRASETNRTRLQTGQPVRTSIFARSQPYAANAAVLGRRGAGGAAIGVDQADEGEEEEGEHGGLSCLGGWSFAHTKVLFFSGKI